MLLLFALFYSAFAVHTSTYNVSGANGNLHHCRDARDARNLLVLPELPKANQLTFTVERFIGSRHMLFDTPILYSIDCPYLAFDCRYKLRFETSESVLNKSNECSTENKIFKPNFELNGDMLADNQARPSDWSDEEPKFIIESVNDTELNYKWNHLPNAAYPSAIGNPKYRPYYIVPSSYWGIKQHETYECSMVKYQSKVSLKSLFGCGALSVTSLANDTIRVASYTIDVSLETPSSNIYGSNQIHNHIYTDKYDNTARVTLTNGLSLESPISVFSATIRNMQITDDSFEFVLAVRTKHYLHRENFSVHFSNVTNIELQHTEKPFQLSDSTYMQYLYFASNSTLSVVKDKVIIDVRTHAHMHRSDVSTVAIDLFITNPAFMEKIAESNSLLSNQVVLYSNDKTVEQTNLVYDGTRVCMINSVNLPADMHEIVGVKLVEAWLCVVSSTFEDQKKLKCFEQRHNVALLKDGVLNEQFNASIVYPGRFGTTSVELCFSTSLEITDTDKLTLEAPSQRYESRIELQPLTTIMGKTTLFSSLSKIGDRDVKQHSVELKKDSKQSSPYTPYHIQKSVRKITNSNAEFHVRAVSFGIAPALGTKHHVSTLYSNVILVSVFLMFFCVIAVYILLSTVDITYYFRKPTIQEYYRK